MIDLVGDVGQWPPPRRLVLALSKAEAALALPSYDPRELTKSFIDAFRLRESAQADGAIADLAWFDRYTADLRSKHAAVEGGYQHFSCNREPETAANAPWRPRRRAPRGSSRPQGRSRSAAAAAERRCARWQDNDIIEIEAGSYVGDVAVWTQNGLLLRGVNGRAHLDSQGRTAQEQGIWVLPRQRHRRGEHRVLRRALAYRNGSGIRFFGRNLTVRDSSFHHNEDGVLTWTSPDSDILIERSVFAHNGAGDGQSHNIYIEAMVLLCSSTGSVAYC